MSSIPGIPRPDAYQPSDPQIYQQFEREAPQIEARKLQLMDLTGRLAGEGAVTTPGTLQIPTQQIAGFDPLQETGFTRTTQGLGSYLPYMGAATNALNIAGGAQYDPNAYQQYMNPYQKEVIGGIESQFDKAANQANLQSVKSGAFGSEREGLQRAELGRQRAEAVGQAQAQNYAQAQQAAMGRFDEQVGRLQNVAGAYGQQAQQAQQLGMGDLSSLFAAGSQRQQRGQQISDAQYRQQIQQMYEPYQRIGFVSDIYQGMPSSSSALTMGSSPMTNPMAQAVGAGITGLGAYQGYQNAFGQG